MKNHGCSTRFHRTSIVVVFSLWCGVGCVLVQHASATAAFVSSHTCGDRRRPFCRAATRFQRQVVPRTTLTVRRSLAMDVVANDTTVTKTDASMTTATIPPNAAAPAVPDRCAEGTNPITAQQTTDIPPNDHQQPLQVPVSLSPFDLAGHWIGHYGDATAYTLLNITYEHDGQILVATKLVDPKNSIPAGQVSFMVDLRAFQTPQQLQQQRKHQHDEKDDMSEATTNGILTETIAENDEVVTTTAAQAAAQHLLTTLSPPPSLSTSSSQPPPLQPMELSPEATQLWNRPTLSRYRAFGQVGSSSSLDDQEWVPGELLLVNERYISFVWNLHNGSIRHWVFLGRPPPSLWNKVYREDHGECIVGDGVVGGESATVVEEVQAKAFGMVVHKGDDDTRKME